MDIVEVGICIHLYESFTSGIELEADMITRIPHLGRRGHQNWQQREPRHYQAPKKAVIIKGIDVSSDLFKSIFHVGENVCGNLV